MDRKILHVDLDAFFASVEKLDNSELKDQPVIVGGTSERGVVATCCYIARQYGISSAMPIFMAKKKCPHGVYVKPRKDRYAEVSREIFEILNTITELVEKVSIDEAYLDVSRLYHSPEYIAKMVKERIYEEIGITLSVGISYNKFLAKLASDWNKPDGIKVITKNMIPDILKPLTVDEVHGIGKKSAKKLNSIGIYTVEDLLHYSKNNLITYLGSMGEEVYNRIRGIDNRPVEPTSERKSYGKEITLSKDTRSRTFLYEMLENMLKTIVKGLNQREFIAKTLTIKVKYNDFSTITRSKTKKHYMYHYEAYEQLMHEIFDSITFDDNVRLIGVTASNLNKSENRQLNLFNLNNPNNV